MKRAARRIEAVFQRTGIPPNRVVTFKLTLYGEVRFSQRRERVERGLMLAPQIEMGQDAEKPSAVRSRGTGRAILRSECGPPAGRETEWPYFGGAGVNPSRLRPGSGFGFGFGAFLTSFLPLSLLPMGASVTQKGRGGKDQMLTWAEFGCSLSLRYQRKAFGPDRFAS
jgi:hypothetical protein